MRLRPFPTLLILIALWASWFIVSTWLRHLNLMSAHFDLGIMDQVLWQTVHGQVFAMTGPTLGLLQSRLAIHGDLLLLAYAPFYALWQDPRTLLTLQVLAVASGALPLFWLARRRLPETWAVSVAALYLLQPVLQWSVLFDIHAIVLATPALLWGVWAAVTKRRVVMCSVLCLTLLAKEEVGLVVALTAVVLGWRHVISSRAAWILGLIALVWVLIMTGLILPRFATNESHFAIQYFSEYGQTVPGVFLGLLRHPIVLWHDLINTTSLGYVAILLGSVGILAVRRPLWILPTLPVVVMNLISNDPHMQTPYYQYTAAITPFLLLASIDGLASLTGRWRSRSLAIWLSVWVAAMIWLWAPLPGMRHHRDAVRFFQTNPYAKTVRELATAIPTNIPLAVSNDLGPHFSRRDRVWVFPNALDRAEAVVVLLNRPRDILPPAEIQKKLQNLIGDPEWTVVRHDGDLWYLRRSQDF